MKLSRPFRARRADDFDTKMLEIFTFLGVETSPKLKVVCPKQLLD
jgi:hypothetical protein